MRPLPFLLAAITSVLAPRAADACSQPPCMPGAFSPGGGRAVPANLPGITWRPTLSLIDGGEGDPNMVRLATVADLDTALPFTATKQSDGNYLLVPAQSLVPGTTYVLTDENPCEFHAAPTTQFIAGPTAPLPSTLGELIGNDDELRTLNLGGCGEAPVDAITAGIAVVLSPDADPWLHALHFQTFVDGRRWQPGTFAVPAPGESWQGRGLDRIYRVCASESPFAPEGLAEGVHEVTMVASLPGTSAPLTAAALSIELACPTIDPCRRNPMLPECIDEPDGGDPGGCSAGGAGTGGWGVLMFFVIALLRRPPASR